MDKLSKAKAHLELGLLRNLKGNNKSFCKYEADERLEKMWACCSTKAGYSWHGKGWVPSLSWSLLARLDFRNTGSQRPEGNVGARKLLRGQEWGQGILSSLDVHKIMAPDRMYPRVVLAYVVSKALLVNFDGSWWLAEGSKVWRKASVTLIFEMGKKEDPGNYRMVSLTLIPEKLKAGKPFPGTRGQDTQEE